jgi:formylglycine-generating enzyme required for sulfatase activity
MDSAAFAFNEPEALRSANRLRHPVDSRQTNLGLRVLWLPEANRP